MSEGPPPTGGTQKPGTQEAPVRKTVRKLDFVVYGMPRGGTTAVANYLSAARGVHCGIEVFPTYLDHATLQIPEGFLTRQDDLWNSSSVETVRENRASIQVYGNKTPTYFYRLPSLIEDLDNCPSIACVRDLNEVATSYIKRARNPQDHWDAGRIGLLAIGDALLLLHALHRAPADANILILPQAALLADWRATMTRALAHISPVTEPDFDPDHLNRIDRIKGRAAQIQKPVLSEIEQRAMRRLRRDGVIDFFARPDVVHLSEVRDDIAAIIGRTPQNPLSFIRRLSEDYAGAYSAPEVTEFFQRWSRQAGRAWRYYRTMDSGLATSGSVASG